MKERGILSAKKTLWGILLPVIWVTLSCGHPSKEKQEVAADTTGTTLCVGDYLTEEQAKEKLKEYAATYHTAAEWQARAQRIRENIIGGSELDQIPEEEWNYPIREVYGAKHVFDDYTVINIGLEVKPGYLVCGNLYLPGKLEGKVPAILNPHGHWFEPDDYGRFRADMQYRCASFARMGAVAFCWDMFGTGEDRQHRHHDPKALKMQLYNSKRVLDYISSLPYVDTTRLAVTGASGGGTQTFLLAAVDPRIDVSVPVVMVSAHFFGGCVCESGMPIHKRHGFETNNVEIAATIAPKPLLLVSDGDDWTKNVPEVEYPYIKRIYKLFDAEENVQNAHFPEEKHDYGFSKRKAVYPFMADNLGLDLTAITGADGQITEEEITLLDTTALKVFPDSALVVDPMNR
jgi:dienelactone hydrolase